MSGWLGILSAAIFLGGIAAIFHHVFVRLDNARKWIDKRGALLVDVDTPAEFAHDHPSGAINIPRDALAQRAHEIGSHAQPIVIFATRWWRGAQAVGELRGMGFWEVLNGAGLATKKRLDPAPRERGERS